MPTKFRRELRQHNQQCSNCSGAAAAAAGTDHLAAFLPECKYAAAPRVLLLVLVGRGQAEVIVGTAAAAGRWRWRCYRRQDLPLRLLSRRKSALEISKERIPVGRAPPWRQNHSGVLEKMEEKDCTSK